MKSEPFYSLRDLIEALGAEWDSTMLDVIPKYPIYYGTEDEVLTTDTNRRIFNHDTREGWLQRYNKPKYNKDHNCWITQAHYQLNRKYLIGDLCTEEDKQGMKDWAEANQGKVKANSARKHAKPKFKEYKRALLASEWMINHDITLSALMRGCINPTVRVFKANTPYKWTTITAYYNGSQTSAIDDGWFKVTQ